MSENLKPPGGSELSWSLGKLIPRVKYKYALRGVGLLNTAIFSFGYYVGVNVLANIAADRPLYSAAAFGVATTFWLMVVADGISDFVLSDHHHIGDLIYRKLTRSQEVRDEINRNHQVMHLAGERMWPFFLDRYHRSE